MPTLIVSDNAPTFTSAAGKMTQWFGNQAPNWNHIAPRAPWWGGCYERHIKTVKTSLKKTIGKSRLTNKQLETLLISIEGSINDRPLLLGYNNCILTPRDFINPHFLGEGGTPPKDLNGVFENQQATLKEFWWIWSSLYLKTLAKVVPKHKTQFPLKLNDIVLIEDENINKNRITWPLGKVIEILPSSDQMVRTVNVQTSRGVYTRPVQRLLLLEMTNSKFD